MYQGGENISSKFPGDDHELCLSQGWCLEGDTYFSLIFAFLEDAPRQCHVFIFQGAEGPKGDKGEKGDTGSPCLQNNHVRSWQHKVSSMTQDQAKLEVQDTPTGPISISKTQLFPTSV